MRTEYNEKINERTFTMLAQKYEQEQGELETRIETLTAQLNSAWSPHLIEMG